MPSAFEKRALELGFMDFPSHVFQTSLTHNKDYLTWLDKVQSQKQAQYEKLGIFDHTQISKTDPRYNSCMLLSSTFI